MVKKVILSLLFLLGLVFVFLFTPFKVHSGSMNNTLFDSDFILVKKMGYKIYRGDIIVFKFDDKNYVKRCLALPGDTVESKNDTLFVNGHEIFSGIKKGKSEAMKESIDPEYYLPFGQYWTKINFGPYVIPQKGVFEPKLFPISTHSVYNYLLQRDQPKEQADLGKVSRKFIADYYFVAGDNRDFSSDSRNFGPIRSSDIIGKVIYILYSNNSQHNRNYLIPL